jgi:pre-mRNA 3'-end-processing factor FIP1
MMPPGMMQDQSGMMQNGPVDQGVSGVGMMPDGYNQNPNGGMMNMGMNEYGQMQGDGSGMVQGMYPSMDVGQGGQNVPVAPAGVGRGGAPAQGFSGSHRGARGGASGAVPVAPSRGSTRGGFAGRGRGRGGYDAPPAPIRPASPLPPGVPTGPRNANKYKDRDNNAPAVEGLDYGGGAAGGRRTPSVEYEERERSSSR